MIQELEEDGDQQTSAAAMLGRGRGFVDLWSFVANEEMYMRDGLHLSGKGADIFANGLKQAVGSGLGNVSYLN